MAGIRIQRIGPGGDFPAAMPLARATPDDFGAGMYRALGELGQTGQQVALHGLDRLIEVKKAQDEEDAKLDMAQQAGAFKLALGEREVAIRAETDAKDYPAVMAGEIDRLAGEAAQRLRYPQVANRFKASLAPVVAAEKVQALNAGIKLQNAQIEALAGLQQSEDANAAVFAPTPGEQRAALERGFTRIQGLVNRGVYSGEQGKAATNAFLGAVERGGVRKEYANPALRGQVIENLMGGVYKYIPPAEQFSMAATMIQRQEQEQKRLDADAERGAKKLKDDALSDLFARAVDKTLTPEEYKQAVAAYRLSPAEQSALRNEMERTEKESKVPSDDATLERVIADTRSMNPKMTEQDLLALKQVGLLNKEDWEKALNRRRETMEAIIARGRTELGQRHAQAEQNLRAALGIVGMFEKLDPASKKAWNLAIQELTRRSSFMNGKEDPIAVADAIAPRYSKMLDSSAQVTAQQAQDVLLYKTPAALDAAFASGEIGRTEYDAQKRLFITIDQDRMRRAGQKLQQDLNKALGKKGGTTTVPKPD